MPKQARFFCPSDRSVHFGGNVYSVPGGDYSLDELAARLRDLPPGVSAFDIANQACAEYARVIDGDKSFPGPRLYAVPLEEAGSVPPPAPSGPKSKKVKDKSTKKVAKKK